MKLLPTLPLFVRTELYFLIARLLSQGPCQNASEVIIIILIVSIIWVFLNWLVFCLDRVGPGAATGAGDSRGECIAYFDLAYVFTYRQV